MKCNVIMLYSTTKYGLLHNNLMEFCTVFAVKQHCCWLRREKKYTCVYIHALRVCVREKTYLISSLKPESNKSERASDRKNRLFPNALSVWFMWTRKNLLLLFLFVPLFWARLYVFAQALELHSWRSFLCLQWIIHFAFLWREKEKLFKLLMNKDSSYNRTQQEKKKEC